MTFLRELGPRHSHPVWAVDVLGPVSWHLGPPGDRLGNHMIRGSLGPALNPFSLRQSCGFCLSFSMGELATPDDGADSHSSGRGLSAKIKD